MNLAEQVLSDIDTEVDEETYIEFSIIDDPNQKATLIFHRNEWKIDLYRGYRYNGPDVVIGERQAEDILRNLADNNDVEVTDWEGFDWFYFE